MYDTSETFEANMIKCNKLMFDKSVSHVVLKPSEVEVASLSGRPLLSIYESCVVERGREICFLDGSLVSRVGNEQELIL